METEQETSIATVESKEIRSKELAKRLNIADSTLRKYSATLEDHGYTFKRETNNNNGRLYNDNDVALLLEVKELIYEQQQKLPMAASIALSRREDFLPAARNEAPTVPRLSDEEMLDKFEQRMRAQFGELMTVEDGKKIKKGIEEIVESNREEIKLLREQNEMLKQALEKEKKKGFFQRLFGG